MNARSLASSALSLGAVVLLAAPVVAQQEYFKANPSGGGAWFGTSVDVEGETFAVGAPSSNLGNGGAVHVFVRTGGLWSEQAVLSPPATFGGFGFGASVSLSGDTLVVGMPNGNGVGTSASGAAYVYKRTGATWTQEAELRAPNANTDDQFGGSVAISGDTLVVGAARERSDATGIGGNQSNNSLYQAGAAFVYTRSGTTWSLEAYVKASNTAASDLFGWSVALDGDSMLVGAIGEDSNATGIGGNQANNASLSSGAVYAFTRSGTTWSQQAYLKASNTGPFDKFGWSLAYSAGTAVVGAVGERSNASGVNGNQNDESLNDPGAAYVFTKSGATWNQQAYLKASTPGADDYFGVSCDVDADRILVGAFREDSAATGVNGDDTNDDAFWAGAAYVFERTDTTWSATAYLKASNTDTDDLFGASVAVSGDLGLVGASDEDSLGSGVGGNQSQGSDFIDAGAAYVYDLGAPPAHAIYCFGDGSVTACPCTNPGATGEGCANSTGVGAVLAPGGSVSVAAGTLTFTASQLPATQPTLLFSANNLVAGGQGTILGDGLRCAGGSVVRLGVTSADPGGSASWGPGLGAAGGWSGGDLRTFQAWYRDPVGSPCGAGFNLSHGVAISFLP